MDRFINKPEPQGRRNFTARHNAVCTSKVAFDDPPPEFRRPMVSADATPDKLLAVDETESIQMALAQAVEQRDSQIAGHCERLAFIGVNLGIAMGLDRLSIQALFRGGYLHDIGKVGIPDSILFKPHRLTAQEGVIM